MINLTKQEKYYLKMFFEDNIEWIRTNSMTKEENIYSLINMYGKFLEDNHLSYARNLQMFLVVLHQEATKAKLNRHSIRMQSLNMNSMPLSPKLSNNPSINVWIEATNIVPLTDKKDDTEIDYEELDRRILRQREKQLLKIRKQTEAK